MPFDDSDGDEAAPKVPRLDEMTAIQDDMMRGDTTEEAAGAAPRSYFSRAGRLTRRALERLAESLRQHGPWAVTHPSSVVAQLPESQRASLFATMGVWGL